MSQLDVTTNNGRVSDTEINDAELAKFDSSPRAKDSLKGNSILPRQIENKVPSLIIGKLGSSTESLPRRVRKISRNKSHMNPPLGTTDDCL